MLAQMLDCRTAARAACADHQVTVMRIECAVIAQQRGQRNLQLGVRHQRLDGDFLRLAHIDQNIVRAHAGCQRLEADL
jgi:hypothetical protein